MRLNTVNVGVIGMGKMGILHTAILASLDDVKITAVAEKDSTLRNYLKNILHDIRIYEDYVEMLRENLDIVYITTPVSLHYKMINDCINHNINFFVEKPLVSNMQECIELCSKLNNMDDIIQVVGYSKRFTDTFTKAREIITSNVLGELIYIKGTMYLTQVFSSGKGWRFKKSENGGVLLELASHLIDLLLWYFGKVESVIAVTKTYYSEVEDFAHAMIKFNNGVVGYIDTSWSVRNYRLPEISIEVHGSNGTLLVNDDYIRINLDNVDNNTLNLKEGITTIYKQDLFKGVPIDIGGPEYTREDIHVIECVKKKKQSILNIFEASNVQAVIDAMYSSAKSNNWMRVNYIE